MSNAIGDYESDDALDHEPPDPEQVAYKLHKLRMEIDALVGGDLLPWDDLGTTEQASEGAQATALVEWLRTHQPEPTELARAIHEARKLRSPSLPGWDYLSDDERAIGVGLVAILLDWLNRQGALL